MRRGSGRLGRWTRALVEERAVCAAPEWSSMGGGDLVAVAVAVGDAWCVAVDEGGRREEREEGENRSNGPRKIRARVLTVDPTDGSDRRRLARRRGARTWTGARPCTEVGRQQLSCAMRSVRERGSAGRNGTERTARMGSVGAWSEKKKMEAVGPAVGVGRSNRRRRLGPK